MATKGTLSIAFLPDGQKIEFAYVPMRASARNGMLDIAIALQ